MSVGGGGDKAAWQAQIPSFVMHVVEVLIPTSVLFGAVGSNPRHHLQVLMEEKRISLKLEGGVQQQQQRHH